jgi:HD-GYP domain-containing protein (c-di-GMP phosphodiesterase class II)
MDQEALIRIGKSLSSERDQDKLLRTILFLSKKITGADAGSIFLLEERDGEKFLRFKYSHTYSMDLEYEEFVMPLDATSIAGYVTLTGKTLNIDDVYNLGPDAPIRFNSAFDQKHGYRTRSMLVTPMTDHTGKVIGVIQLINSKEKVTPERPLTGNEAFEVRLQTPEDFENLVVPFQHRYEDFMQAVAGQAAIAIENNRMIRQIERQFEEFIKAAVFAIESRDPATSGHSIRVAKMCLLLAQAINETKSGPLAELSFSNTELKELYYAALLHDFGKVYIDLSVFMKAKKLTPEQLEILKYRIALIYRTLEYERVRYQLDAKDNGTDLPNLPAENLEKLRELWHKINDLVEPAVVNSNHDEEIDLILEWIDNIHVHDLDGKLVPVLTPDEIKNLRIERGSLNDEERAVIQSHVVHTYNFVKKIPWPEEYAQIPEIAVKHHEMLDGSGYPYQLKADQIPMQARIMALADVFDALAASDRPYKKAIPLEKVLHILKDEADHGKLDANLVQLFLDRQLYLHHQRFGELSSSEVSFLEVPNS